MKLDIECQIRRDPILYFGQKKIYISSEIEIKRFQKAINNSLCIGLRPHYLIESMTTNNNLSLTWINNYRNRSKPTLELDGFISKKGSYKIRLSTLLAMAHQITDLHDYRDINDVMGSLFGKGYPFKKEINGLMLWKGLDILSKYFKIESEIIKHGYTPQIYYNFEYDNTTLDIELIMYYKKTTVGT